MTGTPFIIGPIERAALADLRERAAAAPVDMQAVKTAIETPAGKAAHMRQMTEQSVKIPIEFVVTFSIETGHPAGTCRHMSISSPVEGRMPIPEAVWMAAEALGFTGGLEHCYVYVEDLQGHVGKAVNIIQPIELRREHRA